MAKRNLNKIGDKIYDLRRLKEISQDDLAKRVGVSRQTVIKWEGNVVKPKADKIQRICEALGVETNALMSNKEKSEDKSVAEEVACDAVAVSAEDEKNSAQTKKRKKSKLSKKAKIAIVATVLSIVLLIGIILLVISAIMTPPNIEGIHTTTAFNSWNFSLENLGWAFFSIFISIVAIIGII